MLGKLLKYNLRFSYRNLVIFYSIGFVSAVLTRIFEMAGDTVILDILHSIGMGFVISFACSSIINTFMRAWVRLVQNLYGDESYLTHTLPLEKKTIYTGHFLNSIVTMFTSVGAALLMLFVAFYSEKTMEMIRQSLQIMADAYNVSTEVLLLVIGFVFFLQMTVLIQAGYTGILLGYRMENKRLLWSTIIGFACYMVTQSASLVGILISGILEPDIFDLFLTNQMPNLEIFMTIMYVAIAVYAVILVVYYWLDIAILKKGVNVE